MNKICVSLTLVLSFFLVSSIATAAPTIDGIMSYTDSNDWGGLGENTIKNFKKGFSPFAVLTNVSVEEGHTSGDDYDIEELGLYINDNMLYIGLQTKFDLLNGRDTDDGLIESGDFIFNFDTGTDGETLAEHRYWSRSEHKYIYVGDNIDQDDFAFTFEIDRGTGSVDFILKAGNLTGSATTDFNTYGKDWKITSSTDRQTFQNVGTYLSTNNGKYTIEAAINLNELTGSLSELFTEFAKNNSSVTMFWQPSCGNDFLAVRSAFDYDEVGHAPEPATLALFGMGLLGASAWGRRQKKCHLVNA